MLLSKAFLDTNVMVRYLTGIPPEMGLRAAYIIDQIEDLVVIGVTIAEAAHVLLRVYQLSRQQVIDHLMDFLQKDNITVHEVEKDVLLQGLLLCRPSARVSVPDALIWASARSSGAQVVYSFDQRFPAIGLEVREA